MYFGAGVITSHVPPNRVFRSKAEKLRAGGGGPGTSSSNDGVGCKTFFTQPPAPSPNSLRQC